VLTEQPKGQLQSKGDKSKTNKDNKRHFITFTDKTSWVLIKLKKITKYAILHSYSVK